MILKSFEIKKYSSSFSKYNFYLLYGENAGLKKDIIDVLKSNIKQKDDNVEIISLYENEIIEKEEDFDNSIFSGSLFGNKKIIIISGASDKTIKKIDNDYEKYPENTFIIICAGILDKKSKLRAFFEKNKKTICIPCYLDNEKDLTSITQLELKKNNISLSREAINLLIEKSNSDRGNLRNEIEKIKSYSLNKKSLEINEIKSLINFSGDYKSDILINECLCGNLLNYKKIISELYINASNQILLLRVLSNKVQRLLRIKESQTASDSLDNLINVSKPPIFWKEKVLVKKQLSIWKLKDLEKILASINNTELQCKKNPQISKTIFFSFFLKICTKANSYS